MDNCVVKVFSFYQIPQISYASTSIDLSDKSRFEYFSRVVPPDSFQAQAMADIASYFGWNYVSTLADEGNYGEKGIEAFQEAARQAGVCISQSVWIPRVVTDAEYQRIVKDLLKTPKARVVVMFVNEDNCRNILASMKQMNQTNELTFLASDSWGAKIHPVHGHEENAEGVVTILPKRSMVKGLVMRVSSFVVDITDASLVLQMSSFDILFRYHKVMIVLPETDFDL
ncbi:hypothetical protein CHS0354_031752 [Potamilus streckersoni]|uniref:Receptor ligand binding region domain-containing protein n=1 Tax=Potamilus streckersoni TaxID=2493646 RepID=A0AAE0T635_9BIVA|nr:hypothetical protein CHS0354_031752 [Potamilus streckersoni]